MWFMTWIGCGAREGGIIKFKLLRCEADFWKSVDNF